MLLSYLDNPVWIAYPTVYMRAINRQGYTLKVYHVLFHTSLPDSPVLNAIASAVKGAVEVYSTSITSNDYTASYTRGMSPAYPAIGMYIVTVESGTSVVESMSLAYVVDSNSLWLTFNEDVDVMYITPYFPIRLRIPATKGVFVPSMNEVITFIKGSGWLRIYRGKTLLYEVSGKSAVVTLSFKIHRNVALHSLSTVDDPYVARILAKLDPYDATRVAVISYLKRILEQSRITVIGASIQFDGTYYNMDINMHIDLYSSIDWLQLVAGIASIFAGAVLLALTAGLSLPTSVTVIATGVSLVVGAIALTDALKDKPTSIPLAPYSKTSIDILDRYAREIENLVNQWVSQGKITKSEADTLLGYVYGAVNVSKETINTLENALESCLDEGKKKMYPWIATAGVAGVLAGVILSSRIHGGGAVRTAGT